MHGHPAPRGCALLHQPAQIAQLGHFTFDGAFINSPERRDFTLANRKVIVLPIVAGNDQGHKAQHQPLQILVGMTAMRPKRGEKIVFAGCGL
jgi:hypothetical protein